MTVDREALEQRAQAMLDVPREKRFGPEWDEIVARYDRVAGPTNALSLLAELEAVERERAALQQHARSVSDGLLAERDQLRDALRFYAREWRPSTPVGGQGIYMIPTGALIGDKGDRAVRALESEEK